MKKFLAVLLTLVLALSAIPFAVLTAGAEPPYSVGEIIEFGGYPQSRVTDSATVSALNAKVKSTDWQSYGYYSGDGNVGSMQSGDWMQYCDIYLDGAKYRGVKFTQYRPFWSYNAPTTEKSQQDNNNYFTNTNYWFKWESLRWRILDPAAGLVMSESIIDAQPFQNEVVQTDNLYYVKNKPSVYANNYVHSTVRTWLNNDFYLTAFADAQQAKIKTTTLNNEMYNTGYPQYSAGETNDKIFLLSVLDSLNTSYGFDASQYTYDGKRQAQGTPYAVCQGIGVDNNRSIWTLRIASTLSERMKCMGTGGHLHDSDVAKINGIRPAFTFANGAIQFSPFAVDCDHTNTVFVDNGDGTHTKRCAFCDAALEEAAPHGCGRIYSSSDEGHWTDCPGCRIRFLYAHDDRGTVTETSGNCVDKGTRTYHCSVPGCGKETRTEETQTNPNLHKGPIEEHDAVAATCSAAGSTSGQFCTACNQWKVAPQETDPNPDNHVNTVEVQETFSNCITHGYTAGVYCNDCKQYISGHEEKALTGHAWSETGTITKEATCSEMGETTYRCTVEGCSETDVRTDVPKDPENHVNTEDVAETNSTCTAHGFTAGVYCNDCKQYVSGHEEKALAPHSYGAPAWKWNDEKTTAIFTCENCDETKTVRASVTSETLLEPTDTEKGKVKYTATVEFEGETYTKVKEEDIPALNEGLCKWCGKRHEGFFEKIKGFFHSIAYFFAHLFGKR